MLCLSRVKPFLFLIESVRDLKKHFGSPLDGEGEHRLVTDTILVVTSLCDSFGLPLTASIHLSTPKMLMRKVINLLSTLRVARRTSQFELVLGRNDFIPEELWSVRTSSVCVSFKIKPPRSSSLVQV